MRIIVGISGASGIRLSARLIKELDRRDVEVYTVITDSALKVAKCEGNNELIDGIRRVSKGFYRQDEIEAPVSSSSFQTNGMVIIPCSMNTVAKLAYGIADNLLLRAADIQIKMRNKLIIVPREAPLSQTHLKNLLKLSKLGSVYILFPVLTYYHRPKTLEDVENFVIGRIMDILGIKHELYRRWSDAEEE